MLSIFIKQNMYIFSRNLFCWSYLKLLLPRVRNNRERGASPKKRGSLVGVSLSASWDFSCMLLQVTQSSYDQLRSSTPSPLGLRMFSDLSTICVSWAVLTLAHTQLASISRTIRAISSGTQLLYRGPFALVFQNWILQTHPLSTHNTQSFK